MHYLVFILIGAIAGWLAGTLIKGGGFGLLGDIVVGILGSFVGGWLVHQFGIGGGGFIVKVIIATLGAVVLLLIIRLIKRAA